MKIAVIGSGNVGAALAEGFARAGHHVTYGVRNPDAFKGKASAEAAGIAALPIPEAVAVADIIVLAVPGGQAIEATRGLGSVKGKIIIDAINAIPRPPDGYATVMDAILANTDTKDVVKCFNSTGYENMRNPHYGNQRLDMFMAGPSTIAKDAASVLAREIGFGQCYDFGGQDKVPLLEHFAMVWINLAIMQGHGRSLGFAVLKR